MDIKLEYILCLNCGELYQADSISWVLGEGGFPIPICTCCDSANSLDLEHYRSADRKIISFNTVCMKIFNNKQSQEIP